jgi:hypothetical protein
MVVNGLGHQGFFAFVFIFVAFFLMKMKKKTKNSTVQRSGRK